MAPDEWCWTTIGQEVDLLTGFPFKSGLYTDEITGIPLVRGDNVVQGQFRWDDVKRWPASLADEVVPYQLKAGDIVLAMDRPWIEAGLKYASVSQQDLPCLLVQRVARLRTYDSVDQGFLRYIIGSREFTDYVIGVQTGTAVPHISGTQIREFRFLRPPLGEQRASAHILGTLDNKIELNRRMNATLEAMARALFQSWFVDFDPVRAKAEGRQPVGMDAETAALFPDTFEESDLGVIPAGWHIRPLDRVATFLNGLALQNYPADGNDYLPVIKIAELRRGVTDLSGRASRNIDAKYVVNDGDVLFSWSGSLEVCTWTGGIGALNQHLFKVTSPTFPKWFYFWWIKEYLPQFQRIAAGKATTMGHIQRHHLSEALILVPGDDLLSAMNRHFSPLLDLSIQKSIESRSLIQMRDSLLPKLLSGEIRMRVAERELEAVL